LIGETTATVAAPSTGAEAVVSVAVTGAETAPLVELREGVVPEVTGAIRGVKTGAPTAASTVLTLMVAVAVTIKKLA